MWIWEPYIPAQGLTVLEGPWSVGKTFLALAMAARVSTERSVLLLTDKADWGCIVRPRLDAMAANVNNVYGIDTSPDAMRPGEWLNGKLGALIREKQAGIVIVDTVELFAKTLATRAALERTANKYAAALLMPADLVCGLHKRGVPVDAMCTVMGVSKQAMNIRLNELRREGRL